MSALAILADDVIDPAALLGDFTQPLSGEGAVASFTGHMRPTGDDGAPLDALVLDSYPAVTRASLDTIARDALARFAVARVLVVHRHGRIAPGEAIVFVAAAAAHRRAAFDAVDYLMDRLKTEAVLWKREEGPDGARWIEPRGSDHAAAARWAVGS